MKPMTEVLKKEIAIYIKNKNDISDLIRDVDIRNSDLSNSIIKDLNRVCGDISGCNFSRAIIGTLENITNLCNCRMRNCSFYQTQFIGKIWVRRADAKGSNFNEAHMENFEYQYTNFEDCTFCNAVIRVGVGYGFGAKFSESFFKDLARGWNVQIIKNKE